VNEPSTRAALAFFDRHAHRYDRLFSPSAAETSRELGSLLKDAKRGGVALDLGAGTGRAWPALVEAGLSIVAIDASTAMLREAAKRSSARDVVTIAHDLYSLPWPIDDASCDVVIALHAVFAHPPEASTCDEWRPRFAQIGLEIKRIARVGAIVAIDLPEPAWARTNLVTLGEDRFGHVDDDGAIVATLVPDPFEVVAALDLPLAISRSISGARAVGRR
jgi:SAM-dependent methyltransferase